MDYMKASGILCPRANGKRSYDQGSHKALKKCVLQQTRNGNRSFTSGMNCVNRFVTDRVTNQMRKLLIGVLIGFPCKLVLHRLNSRKPYCLSVERKSILAPAESTPIEIQ